ncbi:hypothetical protein [Streptomyces sp. NPDC058644]|uniref:hypothetical protein n=1 Tax=unclassified Streptomyces TaxID=2593676 RepID=UPI0036555170
MALDQEPLFDFMVVRAPESVDVAVRRRRHVHDEAIVFKDQGVVAFEPEDLHTPTSKSEPGRVVFRRVFCDPAGDDDTMATRIADLLHELVKNLPRYGTCGNGGTKVLPFEQLDRRTYVKDGDQYVLLPDRPEDIPGNHPLLAVLHRAATVAREEGADTRKWDPARFAQRIETALGAPAGGLKSLVLTKDGAHSEPYRTARRALFDALYLLYMMRRRVTVNLEHIIEGLRVLHLAEALVIDGIYAAVRGGTAPGAGEKALLTALAAFHPGLRGWAGATAVPGLPLVATRDDLTAYLEAAPVVHPVFAQLFRYTRPFNDVKPIGVGDLKVVRQWLTAYVPGEISHIHNVMLGERKLRDHRRLEKNEETYSFGDTSTEEHTRDTQSTTRHEVKQEAEQVVKTALGVTANANVSYNGGTVVASLGGGFSYNRSSDATQKAAHNFAREIVDKAVDRVTTQTTSQRSSTRQWETEEKNRQEFSNIKGEGHVSGIYRWVDKEYTAQVYTYGKRLMFEFLVPEPAAFWAESKLRSHTDGLVLPEPPVPPVLEKPRLDFAPGDIDEAKFRELRRDHDLSGFTFPTEWRQVPILVNEGSDGYLAEKDIQREHLWHGKTYQCRIDDAAMYQVTELRLDGSVDFEDQGGRLLRVTVNGVQCYNQEGGGTDVWYFPAHYEKTPPAPQGGPLPLHSDTVTLGLAFRWVQSYGLFVSATLHLRADALLDWQHKVRDVVFSAERKRVDALNQRRTQEYEAALTQYQEELDQLKALTVRDVLQGGSSEANRLVMDEELKKHCLTLITKEFDSDDADDLLQIDAMLTRTTDMEWTRFALPEQPGGKPPARARFTHERDQGVVVPAIDIGAARDKGTIVQFLEQAFEWHHISYLCYPYFWAELPRWVALMNQGDDADPDFTAFLRAGMARVLVAVTPAYEEAALHYLATREAWTGGPAPVIGDPLFLPLHEELRKQTDDRLGGAPDGKPWTFTVPTTLVYLHGSADGLPDVEAERAEREREPRETGTG